MTYILDTDIVSALLKGDKRVKHKFQNAILNGENIHISAISYYEIMRGLLDAKATNKISKFGKFCKKFGIIMLDTISIFNRAANIYVNLKQRGKLIGDADILIASSAIEHNLIVVTNNVRHFNIIEKASIENWLR